MHLSEPKMRVIFFSLLVVISHACNVSHEQAFTCLLRNKCLSKIQIHRKTKMKSRLKSTYILANEGAKYENLFKDCDSNNDGCLEMSEIMSRPSCKRSCRWLETIAELAC